MTSDSIGYAVRSHLFSHFRCCLLHLASGLGHGIVLTPALLKATASRPPSPVPGAPGSRRAAVEDPRLWRQAAWPCWPRTRSISRLGAASFQSPVFVSPGRRMGWHPPQQAVLGVGCSKRPSASPSARAPQAVESGVAMLQMELEAEPFSRLIDLDGEPAKGKDRRGRLTPTRGLLLRGWEVWEVLLAALTPPFALWPHTGLEPLEPCIKQSVAPGGGQGVRAPFSDPRRLG